MSRKDIHPKINKLVVVCSTCNHKFDFVSTNSKDFNVDICSSCHPFYTGKKQFSTTGRVEKFRSKLLKKNNAVNSK